MELLARLAEILGLIDTPDAIEDGEALAVELTEIFTAIRAGEVELPEGATVIDTVRPIGDAVINLRSLDFVRAVAEADLEAELDALAAGLVPAAASDTPADAAAASGDPADPAGDPAEDAGEPAEGAPAASTPTEGGEPAPAEGAPDPAAAEPVAAAGTPARTSLGAGRAHQPARTQGRPAAPAPRDPHARIISAEGGPIEASEIGETMLRGFRNMGVNAGKRTFVRIEAEYDDDHMLSGTDEVTNGRKLQAIAASAAGEEAWANAPITAGGLGWCTPSQVDYQEVVQSLGVRPATAALPSIGVERGGVRVPVSPTLADIDGVEDLADADHDGTAVTIWTEQNDIDVDPEDDSTLKPVQKITCPEWVEFRTYGIVKRLRFGNMAARANPENVTAWNTLANARWARVGETKVLDLIKGDAGTKKISQPAPILGSVRDTVELVLRLVTFMRNAERADDGTGGGQRIRLMMPSWAVAINQADLSRSPQFANAGSSSLLVPRADIIQNFVNAGVNPAFYIDSPSTGPTQLLGKQTDGQQARKWPCQIQFGLWFEGHFAHGDEGSIDLGAYRDRSLNEQNDFETFTESFETVVARRGPEALWVTQKVSPDGTYSASIDISDDVLCTS